jgi:2-polyprenyl-3-methyl-5-hydroxy-6-metoxy-1,4-benzoquinol methylase
MNISDCSPGSRETKKNSMDKTQMAIDVFNKYASDYQSKFMNQDLYHDTFDLFCSLIPIKHAAILDVACGPGNITHYLLKKRPDFQVLGTDLAEQMIKLAKANNPSAQFRKMDCREIGRLKNQYQGVVCGFGLPYLSKEEAIQFIQDASFRLIPGGILYLSTMEGDYSKSGLKSSSNCASDQTFTHYHQEDYLREALADANLEIISISRKDFPEKDGTKTTDLVLIARKAKQKNTFK